MSLDPVCFHSARKDFSTVIASAVFIINLGTFPWGTSYTHPHQPASINPHPSLPPLLCFVFESSHKEGLTILLLDQSTGLWKSHSHSRGLQAPELPLPYQLAAVPSTSNWEGVEKRREDEKCPVRALLHSRDHPCTLTWPRSPLLSALITEIPFYRGHDAVWRKS